MNGGLLKYPRLAAYWARRFLRESRRLFMRMSPSAYEDLIKEEATHWNKGNKGLTWLDSKVISDRINSAISGKKDVYWLLHFMREHAPGGVGPALVLGCGGGALERNAMSIGLCRKFLSYDISAEALDQCARTVRKDGGKIETRREDLNEASFPDNTFGAAFAVNILHHLVNLERVFDEVDDALKPGGFFVINEYVGPRRFQWTDSQIEEVSRALDGLPRKYRRNRRKFFGYRHRLYRPPEDRMSLDSPFEAARSDEILPLLEERFETVERVDIGGALLHPLLEAIVGNFDETDEADVELLESFWKKEKDLMKKGVLGSDFVYAVFRSRKSGARAA